jgi:hypothetical protein
MGQAEVTIRQPELHLRLQRRATPPLLVAVITAHGGIKPAANLHVAMSSEAITLAKAPGIKPAAILLPVAMGAAHTMLNVVLTTDEHLHRLLNTR